jgi:hypothetical protein
MRQAGGSGVNNVKAEINRLLSTELCTTSTTCLVEINVQDSHSDRVSYNQVSKSYPGLTALYRKTFFDATVNMTSPTVELNRLGIPAEESFPIGDIHYKWMTKEEATSSKVVVCGPSQIIEDLEGFKPLTCPGGWTEEKMKAAYKKHNIDTSKLGVGTARSMKQFVAETNTGETHLFSNGKELRRHLDILIVKIRNPIGAYLIETGHSFGKGQTRQKNAFPATKVRPFEDKVWAVRRLLGEVDIPYSSSKIIFGPRRVEKQESPSYPGVMTVYLKQVVLVQLMDLDVKNLGGDDMGRDKWFTQKPLLEVKKDAARQRPSCLDMTATKTMDQLDK